MKAPYINAIHHPSKAQLVLSYGNGFYVVDTNNGEIVKHVQASEATGKVAPVDSFRSMTFSKDGSLLATTGDDKELKVWDTEAWTENSTRPVLKRINALHFTNDGTQVVEADKFGDVYSFPVESTTDPTADKAEEAKKLKPLVGHVSMVTDMVLSADNKYVITADRDEHVRVSRFPNGYNIESFCLGHTDVITNIRIVPWSSNVLATIGGDNTFRLWDFVAGKQLQSIHYQSQIEKYVPEGVDANSADPIAMNMELSTKDNIAVVSFARTPILLVLQWDVKTSTFNIKDLIETPAPVLGFAFDIQGNIWVSLDSDTRVTLYLRKEGGVFEPVKSDDGRTKNINDADTYEVTSKPDYYTVFGLRKYIDIADDLALDREQRPSHASPKKKRKMQQKADEKL
ncbi:hypothetical protein Unana1_02602 [Umbelopsis nana]